MKFRQKRLLALFLTFALGVSQMSGMVTYAATGTENVLLAENTTETLPAHKSYFMEETLVSSGIGNRYAVPNEDVEFVKNQNSFTITFQFKTTASALQALGAINSADNANNYISFYLNTQNGQKRIGMEIRKGQDNAHNYVDLNENFADGNWHTVTYVIKENNSYQFYLDRELVHTVNSSDTKFTGTSGWWNPASVTLAGANRYNSSSNYSYTGSIRNVTMYQGALTQEQLLAEYDKLGNKISLSDYIYTYEDFSFTKENDMEDISIDMADIAALENGTLSFAYRLDESVKSSSNKLVLLSLTDNAGKKAYLYLTPESGTIGFSVDGGDSGSVVLTDKTVMKNTDYHSVTVTFDGTNATFYFDGNAVGTVATTGNLLTSDGWTATKATLGGVEDSQDTEVFVGDMDTVYIYNAALDSEQITSLHSSQMTKSEVFKSEEYGIFDRADFGAYGYRIPALTTTKDGTLLAGIDERNSVRSPEKDGNDWLSDYGNIDTVLRRSTDGGVTWEDPIEVIDLKSQPYCTGSNSALLIDPCFISTEEGRIWMLVDMFPESTAAVGFGGGGTKPGTGYVEVDGEKYQGLYETVNGQDVLKGTIRGSRMYDLEGNPTDYTIDMGNGKDAYHTKGDMYYKGEYVGNIYLHSQNANNDSAPYHVLVTMYIWLTYSDDDGKTWSNPVDVTPMIKDDWMRFCGVGPGVGVEMKNGEHAGRLVFPIYYTPDSGSGIGFQSSACIYSDDGGITWQRGESPNDGRTNSSGQITDSKNPSGISETTESQIIELNNGHLLQFMRNTGGNGKVLVARSTDGGATWDEPYDTNAKDVYCQLSVMHYPELVDGKEIIVMSNPSGPRKTGDHNRSNGILRIGEIGADDSITWTDENMFCGAKYAYSCLSYIGDGKIGLMYEHLGDNVKYTSFNLEYIRQGEGDMAPHITTVTRSIERAGTDTPITDNNVAAIVGDTLKFTVNFDQDILVKGEPKFQFRIGGYGGAICHADYVERGEGKRQLIFTYQVTAQDSGSINFSSPKIICDDDNYVKSRDNYTVSADGTTALNLGSVGGTVSVSDEITKAVDVPYADMTVTAGSEQAAEPISRAFDNDTGTVWHSNWNGDTRDKMWVKFDLKSEKTVSGLRYLPRQDSSPNGRITKYEILVSKDDQTYTKAAEGTWSGDIAWKWAKFDELQNVRYVKLVAVESSSTNTKIFASAAELRITTVGEHTHSYGNAWSSNENGHYHICTAVEGCDEKQNVTEHNYGAVSQVKKATCSVAGINVKTCETCGYEAEETIAAEGHEFSSWEVVRQATAEKTGAKRRYCEKCGTYEEEILPKGSTGGNENENENQNQQEVAAAKEALNVVIESANSKVQTDYTQESWSAFATALQAAKDIYADENATKDGIEKAKEDLQKAMENLSPAQNSGGEQGGNTPGGEQGGNTPGGEQGGNTTGGEQGGNTPGGEQGGNTPGGEQGGNTPGGEQGGTTPDGDTTQTEEEKKAVEAAKNELGSVTTIAIALKQTDYTVESWKAFETALLNATAVQANPKATKEELINAKVALEAATKALVKAPVQTPDENKDNTITVKPGTTFTFGSYKFKVKNEKEVIFTGVSKKTAKVKIASTVKYQGKSYKVTSIASKALKNNKNVTSVTIGANVATIGASAFEGCAKLKSVTIGKKVTKLDAKAFKGCKVLTKVTIPINVTTIGKSAFEGCKKLTTITIKSTKLNTVQKNAFKGINAKAKIKVPKKQSAKYKKLLKNKGQSKTVKIG